MPAFSIVVPVYGVEKYLSRCVDSILSQGFKDFELVLVDDGSPDGCPVICDEYAKRDGRVRVIHKENGGLCSARNAGLEVACGDYVVAVDSDDWVSPNMLQVLWDKAIKPYGADAIIYNAKKVFLDHEEEIPCYALPGYYNRKRMAKEILPFMIWDRRQRFCKGIFNPMACNKIYRRSILLEHHCEDERIRMGEDNAYVFEALYYSNSLVILDDVLYCYYQGNEGSITSSYDASRFDNNRLLAAYLEARLGGLEPWLDDQINAFKAYWLFMAVFHEARAGSGFASSCRHLKEAVARNHSVDGIDASKLPRSAKMFLSLMKTGCYPLVLAAAKAGVRLKG